MTEPLLSVDRLDVWFDTAGGELHVVRDVSFDLAPGERLGLVGESGCGKTTLLLALLGLLPPTATVGGAVRRAGTNILADGERSVARYRWRDMAMVFQGSMNAFNPVLRMGQQLVEPMELHGFATGSAARARARELFDIVGIPPDRVDRYPHQLSGGQRQRAAIALALSCEPKVLLADEPTTALDVIVQAQVLELLARLCDELDLALILVTHDLPLVSEVCDRTAVMYSGEIVEIGPTQSLVETPAHPYTRMLYAATPDIDSETAAISISGVPPRLDEIIEGCPYRPRCDVSVDACVRVHPELVGVANAHWARCLLVGSAG